MTITSEQLDHWQTLCDAATQGPWVWRGSGLESDGNYQVVAHPGIEVESKGGYDETSDVIEIGVNDSAFIAAARDAMPLLVAEVRAARAALNALGIGAPGTSEPSLAGGIELLASALGAAQETAAMARAGVAGWTMDRDAARADAEHWKANFEAVLEAVSCNDRSTFHPRMAACASRCLESIAARDVAMSAAAAEVSSMRKHRDDARTALADYVERERVALMDLVGVMKERDEAVASRDQLQQAVLRVNVAWNEAEANREEAQGILEAVRAELLRATREMQDARRSKERALDRSGRHRGTIIDLRRRLSEQAREWDPQRNVTAGLLRVEQERCARYDEINWGLIEQRQEAWVARDAARAEVERLKAALHDATLEDQMLGHWHVPAPHVPVALAANEDAEWSLAPEEIDP